MIWFLLLTYTLLSLTLGLLVGRAIRLAEDECPARAAAAPVPARCSEVAHAAAPQRVAVG